VFTFNSYCLFLVDYLHTNFLQCVTHMALKCQGLQTHRFIAITCLIILSNVVHFHFERHIHFISLFVCVILPSMLVVSDKCYLALSTPITFVSSSSMLMQ
jgi:hypothetical protein